VIHRRQAYQSDCSFLANPSPAQLAEATGVGKGSLYNTFGSKRQLFDQALARYGRMGAEVAEELLSRPETTRERIGAYLRETVDSDVAQPIRRGCMAVNTAAELGGHDLEISRALRVIERRIVAETLSAAGAHVVGAARTITPELEKATVATVAANLSSPDGATALVDTALEQLGGIDILINNVGGGDSDQLTLGGFLDSSDGQWRRPRHRRWDTQDDLTRPPYRRRCPAEPGHTGDVDHQRANSVPNVTPLLFARTVTHHSRPDIKSQSARLRAKRKGVGHRKPGAHPFCV